MNGSVKTKKMAETENKPCNTAAEKSDMPITPASRPVNGAAGKTGTWRTFKPVVDKESCKKCGLCILYCPEACLDKELEIDYEYCKGCGICANECPTKSIKMERE